MRDFPMYAKLDEQKNVVLIDDCLEWAKRFERNGERIVAQTNVGKTRRRCFVSTVFLGLNHGWGERNLWFETMVFGTSIHEATDRYETWEEAVRGHQRMVARARQARNVASPYTKRELRKSRRFMRRFLRRRK